MGSRGRCCACLRQWLRHVQGRLRRRRRPQGRLPLHCRTSPPPGCHGRYGTEGRLRRGRGPVQEGYPHPEVPRRARNHHQLGRHGEDLAPHLLQRAPRCPRGAARPPYRGPPQPQGQQGEDDPDHVRDLQHARHVRPSRLCSPCTPPAVPPVSSWTPVTVSPTVSPSTRVTLSPTPSSVLTWLAVSSPTT